VRTSSEIRRGYLDFFQKRGHQLRPSAPLIPQGDPTLMFNSAGMVPFKPYFLGLKKDLSRATSSQKCFRTTDIERVGTTLRHLTFFEMLGNFSFGDYFKAEAVAWAWEFLTKELGLDPKRLHPTVFREDDEAEALWRKQGIANPVVRLGEESNFWAVGPTGPCGPCSEIYYDLGPSFETPGAQNTVGGEGDRYLEIWNLVFMQFDRQQDGALKPLPRRNIDTGMGLERLSFALQGKPSPFQTDLFSPITEEAARILKADPSDPKQALGFRVISDHARAAAMLMAEGVIPSNVDRGYVLRRLIRRAARYGQLLGHDRPFLHLLVPAVVGIFESGYPELRSAAGPVAATLKAEEEKFLETLQFGEAELDALLRKAGKTLPGDQAFKLHETFGFPLELTKEICSQRGVSVDEAGFKKASEKAVETARASWKGSGERTVLLPADLPKTSFVGYETVECKAHVQIYSSTNHFVVLDKTPFYAEGGGQVGDAGELLSGDGSRVLAHVLDTQKQNDVHIHFVDAPLDSGMEIIARVDNERRSRIKPHHTATHLMNEALKQVLGPHVRQAGSYVGPDKLRFDFTHPKALAQDEIARIEAIVNEEIEAAHPVIPKQHPVSKVAEFGATTLLGEDYGEEPRFLLIGPKGWDSPKERFSLELCGGTHVSNTAEILSFKIIKESSVSSGVRRIEALAGAAVAEHLSQKDSARKQAVAQLEAREKALLGELSALGGKAPPAAGRDEASLRAAIKNLENALGQLKAKNLAARADAGRRTLEAGGVKICVQRLEGADPKSLRSLSDKAKSDLGSGLVFLAAPGGGKLSFILAATPDLAAKGVDAAKLAKAFAAANGGSAGGRPDFAQGGAADSDWDALVQDLIGRIKEKP
jgi:alanyl-tRNA synthetase